MLFQSGSHYEKKRALQIAFDNLFSAISETKDNQLGQFTPARLFGKKHFNEVCQEYSIDFIQRVGSTKNLKEEQLILNCETISHLSDKDASSSISTDVTNNKKIEPSFLPRKSTRIRKPEIPFIFNQKYYKTLNSRSKNSLSKTRSSKKVKSTTSLSNSKKKKSSTLDKSNPKPKRSDSVSKQNSKVTFALEKSRKKTVASNISSKSNIKGSPLSKKCTKKSNLNESSHKSSSKLPVSSGKSVKKSASSIEALLTSGYGVFDEMIDNFLDEGTHYRPGDHLYSGTQRTDLSSDRRPSWLANYQRRNTRLPFIQDNLNPLEEGTFVPALHGGLPQPTSVFIPFQKSGNHLF